MKSANILIFAVAALAATVTYAADLSYVAVDSVRSWDTASAWSGGALPTSTDTGKLNDVSITVPNYLRITNNVTALASALHIGASATDGDGIVGLKIEQGGTLQLTGKGFNDHFFVGNSGRGSLVIDGGTVAASGWNLVVGNNAGSYGEVIINPGSSAFTPADQTGQWTKGMIVGFNGIGRLVTFADVGFPKLELRVGAGTAGWSSFMAADSTVTVWDCMVGGVTYYGTEMGTYNASLKEDKTGFGEMVLSNATLKIAKPRDEYDNTVSQLVIGRYNGGYGILRGCGVVQGSSLASKSLRIWLNEGRIIADGFGEETSLDFNTAISIRNNTATIASDTTNGWYAVNKGAALFPRSWFNTATASTVLGGWSGNTEPSFVNSVGISVERTSAAETFLRGGFFASDRSDIHADSLPSGQTVVGVWKLGITSEVSNSTVLGYTSAALDFRYDQSKVKTGETLSLYRWTGSAWTRVATAEADSTYRISVSGIGPQTAHDGIYNIGTFALLAKSTVGLMIIVK